MISILKNNPVKIIKSIKIPLHHSEGNQLTMAKFNTTTQKKANHRQSTRITIISTAFSQD
jgi:hypothetical protein